MIIFAILEKPLQILSIFSGRILFCYREASAIRGKKLTEPLETYIQDKCFGGSKAFIPKVACAVLGNKAGIIGAANLTGGKER